MPKSRVLLMVVSVPKARPSLWYCLMWDSCSPGARKVPRLLSAPASGIGRVSAASVGGQKATAADRAFRCPDSPGSFFKEDATGQRSIQHLGDRKLRLQNGEVIALTGSAIPGGERVRQPPQPLAQQS